MKFVSGYLREITILAKNVVQQVVNYTYII
jgi:hypothetical protein